MKAWMVALILAVCCIALLAQGTRPAMPSNRPGQAGRFQIVTNPSSRADTFLLDTATGQIWQRTKYTDLEGQPEVWQIQDRVDSQLDLMSWAVDHGRKPPAPPVPDPDSVAPPNPTTPDPHWSPAQPSPRNDR